MKRYLAIAFATFAICTVILVAVEVEYFGPVGSEASARPFHALGDYYAMEKKDYAKAKEYYTEAINRKFKNISERALVLNNLAAICDLTGQPGRGLVYINQAIKMYPGPKHFYHTKRMIENGLRKRGLKGA